MTRFQPQLLLLFLLLLQISLVLGSAQCPHDRSDLVTWESLSLATDDPGYDVVIAANQKVSLGRDVRVASITVDGELVLLDRDMSIHVQHIRVGKEGKLIAGSEQCPIESKISVTFHGTRPDPPRNALGTTPSDGQELGDKGLAVVTDATLHLHGALHGASWTRLTRTVSPGDTVIHLNPSDLGASWKPGASVVLASTDYGELWDWRDPGDPSLSWLQSKKEFPHQNEEATILSVDLKTGRVELDRRLNFTHYCSTVSEYKEAGYCGEVGLLTRSIVLQGDPSSVGDRFGGHIIIRDAQSVQISGVEITRFGQSGIMGRYPVHWHMMGNQVGRGMYLRRNAIHHNFQRSVAIHDCDGILVQENVAYHTFGHMYFLEDGPEQFNTWDRNLGIYPQAVGKADARQLIPSDSDPSVFWITNANNTFTHNVAVGGRFGYWFIMPDFPTGGSEAKYAGSTHVRPRMVPLLTFRDNIAHGSSDSGLFIDDMLLPDGNTELAPFNPRKGPYPNNVYPWELEYIVSVFEGFVGYKHRNHAIWARGGPLLFTGCKLFDNHIAFNGPPGNTMLENSLIVGETDNTGFVHRPEFGDRSRPDFWGECKPCNAIKAIETYDNGKSQYARNVIIRDFQSNEKRKAGGLSSLLHAPFVHQTGNRVSQLKFENANRVWLESGDRDGYRGVAIMDNDGSVTGLDAGGWILANEKFLTKGLSCDFKPEWNAMNCAHFAEGFVQIRIVNSNLAGTSWKGQDGKDYESDFSKNKQLTSASFYHLGDVNSRYELHGFRTYGNFQWQVNAQARRAYTMRMAHNMPTPPQLQLTMESSINADWVIFAIPYPKGTTFTLEWSQWDTNKRTMRSVNSIAEIDPNSYFFDENGQHLYVMLFNNAGIKAYSDQQNFDHIDYEDDGGKVTIKASCGKDCIIPNGVWSTVPSTPMVRQADRYEGCPKYSTADTNEKAKSFFFFDAQTGSLDVRIHHSLGADVSKIMIMERDREIDVALPRLSPSAVSMPLSHSEWSSLVKGELTARVVHKSGRIIDSPVLCTEQSCSLPPAKSTQNGACSSQGAIDVYTDETEYKWPKWDIWSYPDETSVNLSDEEQKRCGKKSLRIDVKEGAISLVSNHETPITIDTSQFKFLQFFVKSGSGRLYLQLTISSHDRDIVKDFYVSGQYVDTLVIDDTVWSRVRIPLEDLHFGNVQRFRILQIYQANRWNSRNPVVRRTFWVDQVQFIKDDGNDPKETTVSPREVAMYAARCRDDEEHTSGSATLYSLHGIVVAVVFSLLYTTVLIL